MATNKRKTTTAIVAGVTALALALGGTFAWTSIQQEALNESAGIVNVGGRLHDDFNGENKDVYVENFTDPLNGGQPIYARVKLTEYMEVGQDAGGYGQDVNNDGRVVATPVIDGTDINDEDTWKTFIPDTITETTITCADCAEEGNTNCTIHNHWEWKVGGETVYEMIFTAQKTYEFNNYTYYRNQIYERLGRYAFVPAALMLAFLLLILLFRMIRRITGKVRIRHRLEEREEQYDEEDLDITSSFRKLNDYTEEWELPFQHNNE